MKKVLVLAILAVMIPAAGRAGAEEAIPLTRAQEGKIAAVLYAVFSDYGPCYVPITNSPERSYIRCWVKGGEEGIAFTIYHPSGDVVIHDFDLMGPAESERACELKSKIEAIVNPSARIELGTLK